MIIKLVGLLRCILLQEYFATSDFCDPDKHSENLCCKMKVHFPVGSHIKKYHINRVAIIIALYSFRIIMLLCQEKQNMFEVVNSVSSRG